MKNRKKNFFDPGKFFFSNFFSRFGPGESRRETDSTVGPGTAFEWLWVSVDLSNSTTCQNGGPDKFSRIAIIFSKNPKIEISKWRGPGGKPTSPVHQAHLFGGYGSRGIATRGR